MNMLLYFMFLYVAISILAVFFLFQMGGVLQTLVGVLLILFSILITAALLLELYKQSK